MSKSRLDRFRYARQSCTSKVELEAIQAVLLDGIKRLHKARAGKGPGEDPQLHQTPPSTSDNFTLSPVSADLAIATMARIPATPSSMPAPRNGCPCKIASAKLSICSLYV